MLDDKLIFKKLEKKKKLQNMGALQSIYVPPSLSTAINQLEAIANLKPLFLDVLFPTKKYRPYYCQEENQDLYFEIDLNKEQKQIVNRIMSKRAPHPFIVFGPPGTGKSRTLVETIYQLYTRSIEEKSYELIIVCAPSNTAVDVIVKQLLKTNVNKKSLLRFASVAKFQFLDKDVKAVATDRISRAQKAIDDGIVRILCGTLQVLGKIVNADASYIFVDEAGQATEPEVTIGEYSELKMTSFSLCFLTVFFK